MENNGKIPTKKKRRKKQNKNCMSSIHISLHHHSPCIFIVINLVKCEIFNCIGFHMHILWKITKEKT